MLLLSGCDALSTDKAERRWKDGTANIELSVTGRPTPGSLSITEHVLARLKARDVDGLAEFAAKDGDTRGAAKRWVARWGDAAQRPVTADFAQPEREHPSISASSVNGLP
ncbi:hypothetical protein QWM81_04950 [Streptomyces ficellus]|uniref:Uncharacterized protein n=1 Tax=Streptomyces ficellus TaxID=1977088 RepID=A0ABT7Z2A7_9ACTN|nr:hypothetical protein [Streptomyces ficellus]MDN3293397.1 hypothetical protein [Streptomyces ficellus]